MSDAEAAVDPPPLEVEAILGAHPWPAEWASHKRLEWLFRFELAASPEELWPLVADTSRSNRALGFAEMIFEERQGERWGTTRNGGVIHEWREPPWNWVAGRWLECLRVYERGLSRVLFAVHVLQPIAGGTRTRLHLYFGMIPRGLFGAAALRLGFPSIGRAYERVLPSLAAEIAAGSRVPPALVAPPPELSPEVERRLQAIREQLLGQGLPNIPVDALVDWVRTGDEIDLHRIQIRERARAWKLPEAELLRVALHATRAGLLNLSWDTVCPHCRGVRDENPRLAELAAESHCKPCGVDFGTDTPESVEVTFHVHPSLRAIAEQLYCAADAARKDHIRVQRRLAPGAREAIHPPLRPGRYRVRAGNAPGFYLDVDPSHAAEPIAVRTRPAEPGAVVPASAPASLELHNDGEADTTFVVEEATWSDLALRPRHVLMSPDFRDLFSEDYLGAGVRLGVGEQTLLFTDVVGSTALYAARGDPAAFVEIKRHFDDVFKVVEESHGVVVKTIGDAVMAAFVDPVDAVRASCAIHRAFRERAGLAIRLRISLNTGPCIAVRLNANADLFGGTVNIAAKLQALAESEQIAMSAATYQAPGVADYLASHGIPLEELAYSSKALPAPIPVYRWTLPAVTSPPT